MRIVVKAGDVLDELVDVLVCTANPLLAMSGGVNGAILARGGEEIQAELRSNFKTGGRGFVTPGSVVRTGPGPLSVKHVLHAVGVDMSYNSSIDLVATVLKSALMEASRLGARTVATPAIATGYGPLTISDFAEACSQALGITYPGLEELRIVLRAQEDADLVAKAIQPR